MKLHTSKFLQSGMMAVLLCWASAHAKADVLAQVVAKINFYTQTSSAPPVDPVQWEIYLAIDSQIPGGILAAQTVHPGPSSPTVLVPDSFGARYAKLFTSEAAREQAFPPGSYNFQVTGGSQNGYSANVAVPASLFAPSVPYFVGSTFDALKVVDPSLDFVGSINTFGLVPGATTARTLVTVFANGSLVWFQIQEPPAATFLIPANTLSPNRDYLIEIVFLSQNEVPPSAGLGASRSLFELKTKAPLRTVPYVNKPGCATNPCVLTPLSPSIKVGNQFQLGLTSSGPDTTVALLYLGTDGTNSAGCGPVAFGQGEILLALSPFPSFLLVEPVVQGNAAFFLDVPLNPGLVGLEVGFQSVAITPLAPPGNEFRMSNSIVTSVGP
jgi:hypothetical protein